MYSHEIITPLRCISQIVDSLSKEAEVAEKTKNSLKIVSNTAQIVLNHAKASLDKNLIDAKKFTPEINRYLLVKEVIIPTVEIFQV